VLLSVDAKREEKKKRNAPVVGRKKEVEREEKKWKGA